MAAEALRSGQYCGGDRKDLYERAGLQTNRRDYGMLLILRGLVKHSQAYERYQEERAKGFLKIETAERLDQAMAEALDNLSTATVFIRV